MDGWMVSCALWLKAPVAVLREHRRPHVVCECTSCLPRLHQPFLLYLLLISCSSESESSALPHKPLLWKKLVKLYNKMSVILTYALAVVNLHSCNSQYVHWKVVTNNVVLMYLTCKRFISERNDRQPLFIVLIKSPIDQPQSERAPSTLHGMFGKIMEESGPERQAGRDHSKLNGFFYILLFL